MLPSVPDDSSAPAGPRALALTARRGRRRAGLLIARDTAGASAGSAVVGLAVSLEAHSTLAGLLTGGVVWVVGCAGVALMAWLRAFRGAGSNPIDPWALPEPWRGLVRDAVNAGRRFEVATATLPPGPLRDHVTTLEPAVAQQVRSVWDSAQRGAALTGGLPPGSRPESVSNLSDRLRSLQEERATLAGSSNDRLTELDRAEATVASRLREARRAESVAAWLHDGLRSAVTRLEAAVTSLAELAEPSGGEGGLELGSSLDTIGEELSALQAGLREVGGGLPAPARLTTKRRKP